MKPRKDGLGETLRTLSALGFRPLKRRGSSRTFEGPLECRVGTFVAQIRITDWDFVAYPVIRIVSRPPGLPDIIPHVGAQGGMCYFTDGAVILDRYHPEHAILQCLNKARDELDHLTSAETYREGEFQSEFGASWAIGQDPAPSLVLLGNVESDARRASCFVVKEGSLFLVSSSKSDVDSLCDTTGWTEPRTADATCWIIRSSRFPNLPKSGLPRTVKSMFDWLKSWDPKVYESVQETLGSRGYLQNSRVVFLVQCAAGWFGFAISLEDVSRRAFERKPSGMRQQFHGKRGADPVTRLAIEEIGREFIHSRNLTFPSLRDKRLVVVGCGAIGGYLVQALVKLGAGTGSTGSLKIVDPDIVDARNLSRHLLGYESLYKPKVRALKEELLRQFPGTVILAEQRKSIVMTDLDADLVIDATGEEAFSESLNFARLTLEESDRPPVLHLWVGGNGEFCQSLWIDSAKYACFRCLRLNDGTRAKRFTVLPGQASMRVIGCQAFTPYAVSAPMTAASLGVDMVISWLKGDPSPRFRTRLVEDVPGHRLLNKNIEPLKDCPACRRS